MFVNPIFTKALVLQAPASFCYIRIVINGTQLTSTLKRLLQHFRDQSEVCLMSLGSVFLPRPNRKTRPRLVRAAPYVQTMKGNMHLLNNQP